MTKIPGELCRATAHPDDELGLWQIATDATFLYVDSLERIARRQRRSPLELLGLAALHEMEHRELIISNPLQVVLDITAANNLLVTNFDSSTDSRKAKRTLLRNAIARRRLFRDAAALMEPIAVFNNRRTSPYESVAESVGYDFSRQQERVFDALEEIEGWVDNPTIARDAVSLAFFSGGPVDVTRCVRALPSEYSPLKRFWQIHSALASVKGLPNVPEVKARLRVPDDSPDAPAVVKQFAAWLSSLTDLRPQRADLQRLPMRGFLAMMIKPVRSSERFATFGDAMAQGHFSCLTIFLSSRSDVPAEVVFRQDLSREERRFVESHFIAANMVEAILDGRTPTCLLCRLKLKDESEESGCGTLTEKAERFWDAVQSVDVGDIQKEWHRLRRRG